MSEGDVKSLLAASYQFFEVGDFPRAQASLEQAHGLDFEDSEVQSALRACGFWSERVQNLEPLSGSGTRGDYLRREWRNYAERYRDGFLHPLDVGSACLRKWVHEEALVYYQEQARESSDSESLLQAGRCLKILGRYESGIESFEGALRLSGWKDSRLLADLADAYDLIGETKTAKVLMREALFLDASRVELNEIASPLFRRLIQRVEKELDADNPGFRDWLSVYGAVWGVLDVKRELSPGEYGKLKQTIYALKSEIADGDQQGLLLPRLINHLMRLVDHYQLTDSNRSAIDEALVTIKLLSPGLYKKYLE